MQSQSSDNIKTQGRPIPGIDYGINMVSRKKNYDEDGNSLEDYSEDNLDLEQRSISPTQSIKSYRTNPNQNMESPRISNYSGLSNQDNRRTFDLSDEISNHEKVKTANKY